MNNRYILYGGIILLLLLGLTICYFGFSPDTLKEGNKELNIPKKVDSLQYNLQYLQQ